MIGESWDKDVEVITISEALTRIHLEGLIPSGMSHDTLVAWRGYPKPFACGHDGIRGFGPLVDGKENDAHGIGRMYQEKCRVSQHFCSGAILFYWQCVSDTKRYYLNMGACVVIDTPLDCKVDKVLKEAHERLSEVSDQKDPYVVQLYKNGRIIWDFYCPPGQWRR